MITFTQNSVVIIVFLLTVVILVLVGYGDMENASVVGDTSVAAKMSAELEKSAVQTFATWAAVAAAVIGGAIYWRYRSSKKKQRPMLARGGECNTKFYFRKMIVNKLKFYKVSSKSFFGLLGLYSMSQGTQIVVMRAFVGLGLFLVFALAVVSCSFGLMPYLPAMQDKGVECAGMFINECAISQKGLGVGLGMALFAAFLFLLSAWMDVFVGQSLSERHMIHRLFIRRTILLRVRNHILQQFSQGILHPQIY